MSGWICAHRKMWEHPLFAGNAERAGMWLWMLHTAAWKETRFDVKGKTVTLQRGQLCISERQMAEECGVGRQVVRTFLRRLRDENAINQEPAHGLTQSRSIVTICHYEKYQDQRETTNPEDNPAPTQRQPTKEQENNSSNEGADAPSLKKQAFDQGVRLLMAAGYPSVAKARKHVGKWVRDHGEAEVIGVIAAADGRADPAAFIEGRFKKRSADPCDIWGVKPDEDDGGNFSRGGDQSPAAARDAAHNVSRLFTHPAEEERPLPERDDHAGRGGLELLALRA